MNPIKKYSIALAAAASLILAPLYIAGCASPNPNAGQVTVTTNPSTGVSTTNVAPAYIPNTNLTSVVSTISALNSATSAVNPYSGLINLGLGAITLAAAGVAAWKNNQANGLSSQLTAVVQGVEAATTAGDGTTLTTPIAAASVKTAIQKKATAAGVQPALNATVQKLTS